jgi:hypothetical protein
MASVEQRAAVRSDVQMLRARVEGHTDDATLVEISIYGCRIACITEVGADEPVRLSLNGSLPIAATVVWQRDGMVGCRFDTPIGRPLLRSLTIRT